MLVIYWGKTLHQHCLIRSLWDVKDEHMKKLKKKNKRTCTALLPLQGLPEMGGGVTTAPSVAMFSSESLGQKKLY